MFALNRTTRVFLKVGARCPGQQRKCRRVPRRHNTRRSCLGILYPNMNAAPSTVSSEELAALRAQVELLQSLLQERESKAGHEIRQLHTALKLEQLARERAEAKLQDLLRRLYGPKSEQLSADQLRLLLEPLEADEQLRCDIPTAPAVAAKERPPHKGGGRRRAPEHLPIERIEIDLPEAEKAGLVRDHRGTRLPAEPVHSPPLRAFRVR
jgi:hypothetical protein